MASPIAKTLAETEPDNRMGLVMGKVETKSFEFGVGFDFDVGVDVDVGGNGEVVEEWSKYDVGLRNAVQDNLEIRCFKLSI